MPHAPVGAATHAALSEMPEGVRQRAFDRYQKLRPHLEQNAPLTRVAKEASLPLRTAQRWVSRYRRFGLAGLARAERADEANVAGCRRNFVNSLKALPCNGRRSPRAPYIGKSARRTGPGRTAARISHCLQRCPRHPRDLKTLALDGEKAYREAYDLVHRREAEHPNKIWQADHTQLDLWAKRDDGQPARPWLTIIIDDHSRAIAGFLFSFDSPSAVQTALALRQAIWRKPKPHWTVFGIPEVLYTDNGSDFTSSHLEQVAADIKMRLIFSTPGHPRGRGRIERFFETVNQMFLCTLPGYIGGAVRGQAELTLPSSIAASASSCASTTRGHTARPKSRLRSAGSTAGSSRAWRSPWSGSICCC